MRTIWLAITAFAAGALIVGFVLTHREAIQKPAATDERNEQSHIIPADAPAVLKLGKPAQERIGLEVVALEAVALKPEVKGYGRVIDPGPLAAWLVESAQAQAALEASSSEFQRLKLLYAQDKNVSTRALEIAEAARKRDQISVDALQLRLLTGWGRPIANLPDLPQFVRSLAAQENALVRIDLPASETLKAPPLAARLAPLAAEANPTPAEFLGASPTVDPQIQGRGFLFLVKGNSSGLLPGTSVTAYLTTDGDALNGAVVPASAVVRYEGQAWVYARTDDATFARRQIAVDHPVENGWFVTAGVTAKEFVVVSGAAILLSEELNRAGRLSGVGD